jgi:DNA topoisomerase-1
MAKNLVIVESPAKAKTIEGFLGKDFEVKSSFGHVRDLDEKGLSINIEKNFEPQYQILPDKIKVVSELKKIADKADTVWLATDEDREGEAISWHLFEALKLKENKTKRIVFSEITKPAILNAIKNPRGINLNLVDAQQARRVLDRLVGYELSPVLWKKVKPSLSAGRVQSVAVRIIVEREREIIDFKVKDSYKIAAVFESDKTSFKAELPKKFDTENEAYAFLEKCNGAIFKVEELETKPSKKTPSAPFTTSTLQQEASRKLGFSVSQTMVIAQRLYESGKITYMRTDSVNLSETAMDAAKEEILKLYGKEFYQARQYKTKTKGAQEAHEAIRPTYMNVQSIDGDSAEKRLYELIWKRTIASQMSDAQLERTIATIGISTANEKFVAQGEILRFEGFLKVYLESTDDEEEEQSGMLPPIKKGQILEMQEISAVQRFTHHPPRYTEASLVKKLEELGIGRPSTYAPTISTILKRGYVVKEDRPGVERKYTTIILKNGKINKEIKSEITGAEKAKLFPTDIGMVVNDFLVENFDTVMNYNFTATVEKEFDDIAEGQLKWNKMIEKFYKQFHATVEHALQHSERATGERFLGNDPKTGKPVYARIGRFGPMIQIGNAEDEEKPLFASLRSDQRLEQITLDEALELFKLPRTIGVYENEEIKANIGRFGPYLMHKKTFYSIPKTDDPMSIELNRAIEIIEAKRKAEKEKIIKTFKDNDEVKVLNGRYGPYIALGKNNYKIPKGTDPAALTLEECLKLASEQDANNPKKARFAKKNQEEERVAPKKKTTTAKKKKAPTTKISKKK